MYFLNYKFSLNNLLDYNMYFLYYKFSLILLLGIKMYFLHYKFSLIILLGFKMYFLAHLAHSANVSFWDRAVSVVSRRASSVVRRPSTIYSNIFFSKITDGKVIKLCIDVP